MRPALICAIIGWKIIVFQDYFNQRNPVNPECSEFFLGKGKKLFSVAPTSAVINEKKLFIAKCRVLNVIRGNIGFYRVDTLTQVNNNRTNITMTKDKDFYNITMVIRNLTLNDSGTYRCSEKDVLTNDYADVTLTVKGNVIHS